jgi:hypothetical protein
LPTVGVGHPPQSLPDVGRTDARRRKIDRPDGVTARFQVRRYKVEPHETVRARNLFAKDDIRAKLGDEPEPGWPKVPLVSKPKAFACAAERLARAGPGVDGAIVRPSGEAERVSPQSDTGEEMALREAREVGSADIPDVALIDMSIWNKAGCNEVAEPR